MLHIIDWYFGNDKCRFASAIMNMSILLLISLVELRIFANLHSNFTYWAIFLRLI